MLKASPFMLGSAALLSASVSMNPLALVAAPAPKELFFLAQINIFLLLFFSSLEPGIMQPNLFFSDRLHTKYPPSKIGLVISSSDPHSSPPLSPTSISEEL